jgi:DNA sulfur modification protein DndD
MKIKQVEFYNFRQYYDNITIDLGVTEQRNTILVGGKNGHGKTTFLLGLVWCLYGDKISNIDDVFKKEVKGNYSIFRDKNLNWVAKEEGKDNYYIDIIFHEVELSEIFQRSEQGVHEITIRRSYSSSSCEENFEIFIDGDILGLLSDKEDKVNFIDDYLIPIDIAKFIFFDAEKIAEIVNLSVKDQANIMNETLSKVLGLSTYENLMGDIETYKKKLLSSEAPVQIKLQIETAENAQELNNIKLEEYEKELDEIDENKERLRTAIASYNTELARRGDKSHLIDLTSLRKKESDLQDKLTEISQRFEELSYIIPFCITATKLEEVHEQLKQEEELKTQEVRNSDFLDKTKEFTEELFNKAPYPVSDIDFEQKRFYYDKAKQLISKIYGESFEESDLEFYHDMTKQDREHFKDVLNLVKQTSKDSFDIVFGELNRLKNEISNNQKEITLVERNSQDELSNEFKRKRAEAESELSSLDVKLGSISTNKQILKNKNETLDTQIKNLLDKINTSKVNQKYIEKTKLFTKTLTDFVKKQKDLKCTQLSKKVQMELNRLLHTIDIGEVDIKILPENNGLEVNLYDKQHREIPKDSLSKGQQQLYISCLLKGIFSESIHDLPVFIDTPLGRLDSEHRDNILENYYPELSEQVIIFSTDTEITTRDIPKIENYISKYYRLVNQDRKTVILDGYFEQ